MNNTSTGSQVLAVPKLIKVTWGSGALGVSILMNAMSFFALFYMVDILLINPFLAGSVLFASKLFDVFTDPIVGAWSDRLNTSGSRRRPFLVVGAFISAVSFALIFSTPMFDAEWMRAAYIFVALLFYTLGYTLFNVPYISMPAEMTDDYNERSSIFGYRMVFVATGSLLVGSAAPMILGILGRNDWSSYALVGSVGAVIILVSMLTAWAGSKDARFTSASTSVPPNLFSEVRHVIKVEGFVRLLGAKALQLLGIAATSAALLFFVDNTMGRDFDTIALYGLVLGVGGIAFTPALVWLSRQIGKRNTYILAASSNVIASISWYWADSSEPSIGVVLRALLIAVAFSGNVIMAMSILSDIINGDAAKNNVRREGVFTSFYSFVEKFTFAFGPLLVGVALGVAGFNKDLSPEELAAPAIQQAMLLGVCYLPAVLGILSVILLTGIKDAKPHPATSSA